MAASSLIMYFPKRCENMLEEMWEALSFQLHRSRQLLHSKVNFDTQQLGLYREFDRFVNLEIVLILFR